MTTVAAGEWVAGEERLEVCHGFDGYYWHLEVHLDVTTTEGTERSTVHVTDDQVRWLRDALSLALEVQREVTPLKR
ncbi:hypothetical protein AAII07_01040 [Microvirga sp. 0TCS3.31]